MHLCKRRSLLTLPAVFCLTLVCSNLEDSTDLGAGVIEDVYPDRVTIGKHLRQFSMDSSSCDSSFSLPGQNDTGFGVHPVTGSHMIIGTKSDSSGNAHAAGYMRFVCPADTARTRTFALNDTLRKIIVRFYRDITVDTNTQPCRIAVWSSDTLLHALKPNSALGDTIRDTLQFVKALQDSNNTSTIPDSIELLPGLANDTGRLANKIFKACTTSSINSSSLSFCFILSNLDSGLIRFKGNADFTIKYTRGSDTSRSRTYGSAYNTSYYIATDGDPDSLQERPELRYVSKRTAVYRYDATALWDTVNNMANTQHAQIISASFSLTGPSAGDTLNLRYLLHTLERNGDRLDSLFAAAPANQSVITVADTSRVWANVRISLQNLTLHGRPPALYLYLRYNEDINQKWKQTRWLDVPLLTATIAVP
jgi:hypothetical protein